MRKNILSLRDAAKKSGQVLRRKTPKYVLLAMAMMVLAPPPQALAQDFTSGLVGHWLLDETSGTTAYDATGTTDGTYEDNTGSAAEVISADGPIGGALSFTNHKVSLGTPAALDFSGTNAFTISAWVNLKDNEGEAIFSRGAGNNSNLSYFFGRYKVDETQWEISIFDGTDISTWRTGPGTVNMGGWALMTLTWDGNDLILYENGKFLDSRNFSGKTLADNPTSSYQNTSIGGNGRNDNAYFDGYIDDVRVYNRALTAPDIQALYDNTPCPGGPSGAGVKGEMFYNQDYAVMQYCNGTEWVNMGKEASVLNGQKTTATKELIRWWRLDETSGTTAADSSGNGYDATMGGGLTGADSIPGPVGTALYFDGVDDDINFTDINFAASDPWTVTLWLLDPGGSGYYFGRTGVIDAFISWNGDYAFDDDSGNVPFVSTAPYLNKWTHHAYAADGAGNLDVYMNGTLVNTIAIDSGNNGVMFENIGHAYYNSNSAKEAGIDDVRIFNYALSQPEIEKIISTAQNCPVPESGLVGHWPMDESGNTSTAADSTSYSNDGTLSNFPADPTANWVNGSVGNALDFDGIDDRVSVANVPVLDITGPITISAWVNGDLFGSGNNENRLVMKGSGPHLNNLYTMDIDEGNVTISLHGSAPGDYPSECDQTSEYCARGTTVLNTGQWYHVVATYDGSTARVYVNGVLDGSNAFVSSGGSNTDPVLIGGRSDNTDMFDGKIDDVRIYNRALSDAEVASLYGASGGTCNVSLCENPIGHSGEMIFNSDDNVMKYCDGHEWNAMGPPSTGGAGCSDPSGEAGSLIYNDVFSVLQYCDGGDWRGIGNAPSTDELYAGGLVTHFKLDETTGTAITDSSGNGFNGTMNGDLDADTDSVAGVDGTALRFAGTNVTSVSGDTQDNMTNFTACTWFNLDSLTNADSDNEFRLFSKGSWSATILDTASTPYISFRIATDNSAATVSGSTTIAAGQWYHMCGVHNGIGTTPDLYINGVEDESGSFGGNGNQLDDASTEFWLSTSQGNNYYANLPGILDDVRVYNRALNAAEVSDLFHYTGSSGPYGCPDIGDTCSDGSIYAGITQDGDVPMYVTTADYETTDTWNDGNTNYHYIDSCYSEWRGACYTARMLAEDSDDVTPGVQPHNAAVYCDSLSAHGHDDWYLPARAELLLLWNSGSPIAGVITDGTKYHSSYERNGGQVWGGQFNTGGITSANKDETAPIRCVRK